MTPEKAAQTGHRAAVLVPVPPPDPGESPTGWGWPGVVTAYFDAIHEEIR